MKIDQSRIKESVQSLKKWVWKAMEVTYRHEGIVSIGVWIISFILIYSFLIKIYWYSFFEYNLINYITTFILTFLFSFVFMWKFGWTILNTIISIIASLVDMLVWKDY